MAREWKDKGKGREGEAMREEVKNFPGVAPRCREVWGRKSSWKIGGWGRKSS